MVSPEGLYVSTGAMTLTTASYGRMRGSLDLALDDGSELDCSFDLRRAYELDTDD